MLLLLVLDQVPGRCRLRYLLTVYRRRGPMPVYELLAAGDRFQFQHPVPVR